MSKLRVQEIAHTNGTVAATVNSSGVLSSPGHVVQVVQFINTTNIFTTSTSLVATGFIGSITPSSSTNKILFKLNGGRMSYASTPPTMRAHLYRKIGTGSYADITNAFLDVRISSTYGVPHSFCYLDSPSTTNEVSYQAYFYSVSGDEVRFDSVTNTSLIMTLMEIAA